MTYTDFVLPNETEILWTLMIVTYPYITGLIAGAFVASALYHVFSMKALEPVNRFALLVSLAFALCCTLPLLFHLGRPERAFNIMIHPNFRSALAGFGFIYSFYLIVLVIEIWLSYRVDMIDYYNQSTGLVRRFWSIMTLGVYDKSSESIKNDNKFIHILAVIGIPAAFVLHGYVGFLFGSLKSNPWWKTPLMPQLFLISAIMSGLACLILLYVLLARWGVLKKSFECLRTLTLVLWFTIIFMITFEALEILFFYYEQTEEWVVIATLLSDKLFISMVILQWCIGLIFPFFLFTFILFSKRWASLFTPIAVIASALTLFEVWMMRWNVVIGGQMFSKSFVGYREYHPLWFGKEGIIITIILTLLPMLFLYIFYRFVTFKSEPLEAE